MTKVVAIVPAAGVGKRLKSRTKKPFVMLGGLPLAAHALKTLDASKAINAIVIAADKSSVKRFRELVKRLKLRKVADIVIGGRARTDSVRNCLRRIGPSFDIILIHDAARPFIDAEIIDESIRLAKIYGGCIAAVPESDTVKFAGKNLFIEKTLDRNKIFRAQTPQVFRYDVIKKAYGKTGKNSAATDDAFLVEKSGGKIKILKSSYRNIKITTGEDLKLAEVLL